MHAAPESPSAGLLWQAAAAPDKIALTGDYARAGSVLDIGAGAGWYSRLLFQRGAREVARVTRRRVLLSVPSSNDAFLFDYGLSLLHHIDKTHVREYTPEALSGRLAAFGFQVVETRFSIAASMPLVTLEFFRPGLVGRLARRATSLWLRALMRMALLRNQLPGDILCVADRVE